MSSVKHSFEVPREDAGLRLHHEVFDDTPALLRRIYELFGRGDARPVAASPRIAA